MAGTAQLPAAVVKEAASQAAHAVAAAAETYLPPDVGRVRELARTHT